MEVVVSFSQIAHFFSGVSTLFLIILPILAIAVIVEMALRLVLKRGYPYKHSLVSFAVGVGHVLTQAVTYGIIIGVIGEAAYHFRLFTVHFSWSDVPLVLALFIACDFFFYWEHRTSHRVRFLWATHSVHHSAEDMVLSTAIRLGWTALLSGIFFFYLPLVLLGFSPKIIGVMISVSLLYQIFVHTELVPHIPGIEWIVNTPSAHRVHHGSNHEYIDKNFGGVFLIWDHLFGTYQKELENVDIRYGLVEKRSSWWDPFVIAYGEFWNIGKSSFQAKGWRAKLGYFWHPPGWSPTR